MDAGEQRGGFGESLACDDTVAELGDLADGGALLGAIDRLGGSLVEDEGCCFLRHGCSFSFPRSRARRGLR